MDLTPRTRIISILLVLLSSECIAEDTLTCKKSDSCSCLTSNGTIINLESLAHSDGTARFNEMLIGTRNTSVWYNPCKRFTGKDECKDAAGCAQELDTTTGSVQRLYAKQENVQWTFEGDKPKLKYIYGEKFLEVSLICQPGAPEDNSTLTILNITSVSINAELNSVCACYDGCAANDDPGDKVNGGGGGLSTGSIIVILFFVSVFVYLVGGIIYNKVLHGATGKELIPNVEFWMSFPKLVLDGVAFVCNCCRSRRGATGYDDV